MNELNVNRWPRGSAKSFLNVAYERYVESLHWSFYFRYYHIINNKRCMTDVTFYKWLVTHHLIDIGYVEQAAWDFETALKRFFGEE